MALPIYLAMTGWEIGRCPELPRYTGFMACHFSSGDSGLAGIPRQLPENALLMVDDQTPPDGHDPARIARQLQEAVERLRPAGVILDFQRPYCHQTQAIVQSIQKVIQCPAAVTSVYQKGWSGGIFVPPVPGNISPEVYLKPWLGRQIWLEMENTGTCLTVTEQGCFRQLLSNPLAEPVFADGAACCHYSIAVFRDRAQFCFCRTPEDQAALLEKAEALGTVFAVGLYQEFRYTNMQLNEDIDFRG